MKFTCTKENILYGLQVVSGLATKPSHLPILSHIRITATESGVELVSTNLEIAIKAFVRAKVEQPGSFTVPAKTLLDYVQLLSDEQLSILQEGSELVVSCGRSSTKIKGSSAEEYPVIPEVEEQHAYALSAKRLKESLSQIVFAAAKNEIRPELSGVFMGFFVRDKKGLILAATDSYRLAERFVHVDQGSETTESIVPGKTVTEFVRLLSLSLAREQAEHDVRMWISGGQIALRFDQFEVTSRLVDGTYPDYTQIIPTEFKTTVTFSPQILVNSIKAASLFTTSGVNAVTFHVEPSESRVGISSTSTQTGEHETTLDVEVLGETNDIVLNHRYVLDGLSHLAEGDIEFKMNATDAPCLFKAKESDDYVYIVMPIRQ
ncbi:MAG: DNA polymerase III subunit beta [Candidatus Magasanikbacteria bacterium CG10_big_fil_rev_8_21_14_0_10_43_6]|uniref:Beta sliding clamp n=1 Tax=Candidatus Magasanikbacteria bacterium CG10_big_fil_rev_8_21_14_0_10_43_6 TaxID=1974650 RepID=A0A2M6W219_9BACT|nr:MAG: DNA polymerase III subunit beta [Candidatus Magasanikbacteria bacterium CG10_big_fil_rev_8_21_14_0_10_43_6]